MSSPSGPTSIPGGAAGNGVDQHVRVKVLSRASRSTTCWATTSPSAASTAILNIGPNAEGQAPNTGVFQNRIAPSGNAIWMLGKHTLSFGASYTYTQLNTIDKRTGTGTVATDDFSQMMQGFVTPGSSATGFYVSRSCRAMPTATTAPTSSARIVQDKWQIRRRSR